MDAAIANVIPLVMEILYEIRPYDNDLISTQKKSNSKVQNTEN